MGEKEKDVNGMNEQEIKSRWRMSTRCFWLRECRDITVGEMSLRLRIES